MRGIGCWEHGMDFAFKALYSIANLNRPPFRLAHTIAADHGLLDGSIYPWRSKSFNSTLTSSSPVCDKRRGLHELGCAPGFKRIACST